MGLALGLSELLGALFFWLRLYDGGEGFQKLMVYGTCL